MTELQEQLSYSPDTGAFTWKVSKKGPGAKAGQKAGCMRPDGYYCLKVNQRIYLCHRLAWLMMNGPIPEGMDIDHINGDPSDNRLSNLRLATRAENLRNAKRNSCNTSGVKGVARKGSGWAAYVIVKQKQHYRWFKTKAEAVAAVTKMREELHGEFARHA